jgi:hypothetical protein
MKLTLKLAHNDISLSFDCVKIKSIYIYIYINCLESQIMVYAARHRVRIFISYKSSTGWCLQIVFRVSL